METKVEIIYSRKRKKTISAELNEDRSILRVLAPYGISQKILSPIIEKLKNKTLKKRVKDSDEYLLKRSESINKNFFSGNLKNFTIYYSGKIGKGSWGLCNLLDREIKLNKELSEYPEWVIDYVIMHEMTHLIVSGHNKEFWDIVNRYDKTERAIGFLIAKGMELKEN
ncbi:MAG: M48 family metallopeptidase [Candidatus Delongbacteria bacterium]|nr:M48 family metallopeptidase [Candidatus Delongbacteria bacterium]MBN2837023.1 M48 family metallopeptidase [Candidatus Delongbacteria bacterium]